MPHTQFSVVIGQNLVVAHDWSRGDRLVRQHTRPENPEVLWNRAVWLANHGQQEKAEELLESLCQTIH